MTRTKPLTSAQLNAAMAVVTDRFEYPALEALCGVLTVVDAFDDNEPMRVAAEDPLPVSVAQIDEALTQLDDPESGLDARTLRTLKRARDLLAEAEKERAAEDAKAAAAGTKYVSRAEFDALRTAQAIALAQLISCVSTAMWAPGRYFSSMDAIAEKEPAAVKRELQRLLREARDADTLDIAADRARSAPWQPGYRPY